MATGLFLMGFVVALQWLTVSSPTRHRHTQHDTQHICARGACEAPTAHASSSTSSRVLTSRGTQPSSGEYAVGSGDYLATVRRVKSPEAPREKPPSNSLLRPLVVRDATHKKPHHLKAIRQTNTPRTLNTIFYADEKSSISNEQVVAERSTNSARYNDSRNKDNALDTVDVDRSTFNVSDVIRDGVYWSLSVERLVRPVFDDDTVSRWRTRLGVARVVNMTTGCGRMQNRRLQLSDDQHACARYRLNTDQIQGDVFSFHLSRLLGVHGVPPSVLLRANATSDTWRHVSAAVTEAGWRADRPVVLTPWLHGLVPAYIPPSLRPDSRRLHPTAADVSGRTAAELAELLQWSDLIVFDYVTANVDRVVNNLFNRQWNDLMMDEPAHNLMVSSGSLVLLDNESGLFHSYRLLDKYARYHESLLNSLCVFRKTVADRIEKLFLAANIGQQLAGSLARTEPLSKAVPKMPQSNIQTLHRRIGDVYRQIVKCKHMHRPA